MIVGITGTNGSGKGTVAEFLKTKGFKHYSVGGFLEEELKKKSLMTDRDNKVLLGNQLRSKYGPGYIVEKLYEKAEKEGGDAIIESIRVPGEIGILRKKGNFVLFAVDADPEIRYSRIIERGTNPEILTYEDFLQQEEREIRSNEENKQNLSKCIELADHLFINNWTKEELCKKVANVLGNRGPGVERRVRPTWDEYFMEIAKTVSLRSTCDMQESGAVIAKDKQILVTGYVGSPKGLKHCDESGHQMEELVQADGSKISYCIRTTHAEQNAICQAAKLGVPIDGATIYCQVMPCMTCAKMIINSGIKVLVYGENTKNDMQVRRLLEKAGIQVETIIK